MTIEGVITDRGGPPDVHLEHNCVTTSIFAMPWALSNGETFTNTLFRGQCHFATEVQITSELSSSTEMKHAMGCMMMHRQGISSLQIPNIFTQACESRLAAFQV